MITTTNCETLCSIKGGEHKLGYAWPGDLFFHITGEIETQEEYDEIFELLNSHWERRCWLITTDSDVDHTSVAQKAQFMRIYEGVWYRVDS